MEIDPKNSNDLNALDKKIDLTKLIGEDGSILLNKRKGDGSDQKYTDKKESKRKKISKKRCAAEGCKKKLTLTDMTCKCELRFCSKHRYPEEHSCTFDFKAEGQQILKKQSHKVVGDKFEKL